MKTKPPACRFCKSPKTNIVEVRYDKECIRYQCAVECNNCGARGPVAIAKYVGPNDQYDELDKDVEKRAIELWKIN